MHVLEWNIKSTEEMAERQPTEPPWPRDAVVKAMILTPIDQCGFCGESDPKRLHFIECTTDTGWICDSPNCQDRADD